MSQAAGTRRTALLFRPLIYGLILASSAAQFAIVPVMPNYAHRLGLSGLQQGMVLGATGLAALAVSLPAGALSDRFGARRITLWAGLMMTIAMLGQSFAGNFAALFAAGNPRARVIAIANSDHDVFNSNPAETGRAMNAFMDALP